MIINWKGSAGISNWTGGEPQLGQELELNCLARVVSLHEDRVEVTSFGTAPGYQPTPSYVHSIVATVEILQANQ